MYLHSLCLQSDDPLVVLSTVANVLETILATANDKNAQKALRDVEKATKAFEKDNLNKAEREIEDAQNQLGCDDDPQDPSIVEACLLLASVASSSLFV